MSFHAAKLRQCKYLVRNVYAAEMGGIGPLLDIGTKLVTRIPPYVAVAKYISVTLQVITSTAAGRTRFAWYSTARHWRLQKFTGTHACAPPDWHWTSVHSWHRSPIVQMWCARASILSLCLTRSSSQNCKRSSFHYTRVSN